LGGLRIGRWIVFGAGEGARHPTRVAALPARVGQARRRRLPLRVRRPVLAGLALTGLLDDPRLVDAGLLGVAVVGPPGRRLRDRGGGLTPARDRKSTRLNSSHVKNSYA